MNRVTGIVLTLLLVISSTSLGFASDAGNAAEKLSSNGLSKEAADFLEDHGVDLDLFKENTKTDMTNFASASEIDQRSISDPNALDSAIISLKHQTVANGFTDEQVQAYVSGLVDNQTTILGQLDGSVTPMANNRPDDDGVGYEVKSLDGYYQTTTFAKVPSAYRGKANDTSAYMFWTLKDKIDIGIWYSHGTAGTGWRVFWMSNGVMDCVSNPEAGLYSGRNIYFTSWVVDNNWARIRIVNGSNFDDLICDYSVYIGGLGITRTNNNWNRQITLCKEGSFTGGGYLTNAEFSDAYIYKTNGTYAQTLASNCVAGRLGSFGTNDTTKKLVTVDNTFTKLWYSERVSINF